VLATLKSNYVVMNSSYCSYICILSVLLYSFKLNSWNCLCRCLH